MSENQSGYCKKAYNKEANVPIILSCGRTISKNISIITQNFKRKKNLNVKYVAKI